MECRAGEGAPSGSFFLIKDGIGEDCGGRAHSACKVSSIPCHRPPQPTTTTPLPPPPPHGRGSLSLPSVSPHQQGSHGGQVLPPDAAFNAIPPVWKGLHCESPPALAGERKHTSTHSFWFLPELQRRMAFFKFYFCFIQSRKDLFKMWKNWVFRVSVCEIIG